MVKPKSKVPGRTHRGNLSPAALLRPDPAWMMSSRVEGSRPALTPMAMTSDVITMTPAARMLLASLATWACPGLAPV